MALAGARRLWQDALEFRYEAGRGGKVGISRRKG